MDTGLFDPVDAEKNPENYDNFASGKYGFETINSDEHVKLSREGAAQSLVLLSNPPLANSKGNVLPAPLGSI